MGAVEIDVVGNLGFVKILDDFADERRYRADRLRAWIRREERAADLVERSDQRFTFDEVIIRELYALLDQTADLVCLVRSRRADVDACGIGSLRERIALSENDRCACLNSLRADSTAENILLSGIIASFAVSRVPNRATDDSII